MDVDVENLSDAGNDTAHNEAAKNEDATFTQAGTKEDASAETAAEGTPERGGTAINIPDAVINEREAANSETKGEASTTTNLDRELWVEFSAQAKHSNVAPSLSNTFSNSMTLEDRVYHPVVTEVPPLDPYKNNNVDN